MVVAGAVAEEDVAGVEVAGEAGAVGGVAAEGVAGGDCTPLSEGDERVPDRAKTLIMQSLLMMLVAMKEVGGG